MKINKENYEIFFLDYSEGTLSNLEKLEVEKFMAENPELAAELDAPLPSLNDVGNTAFPLESLKKTLVWDEAEVSELLISELEGTIEARSQSSSEKDRLKQFSEAFPAEVNKLRELISLTKQKDDRLVGFNDSQKHDLVQLPVDHKSYATIAFLEGDLTRKEQTEFQLLAVQDKSVADDLKLFKKTVLVPVEDALPANFKDGLKRKRAVIIPLWAKRVAAVAAIFIAVFFVTNQGQNSGSVTAEFSPREKNSVIDYSNDEVVNESTDHLAEETAEDKKDEIINEDEVKLESDQDSSPDLKMNREFIPSDLYVAQQPIKPIEELEFLSSEAVAFLPSSELINDPELRGGTAELFPAELFPVERLAIYQPDEELLAEAPPVEESISPFELVSREIRKNVSKDSDESLAVSLVNKTAQKLSGDEEFMAYSDSESRSGFRLKIGKLSIESTK